MKNKSSDLQERCFKFARRIINLFRKERLNIVDTILARQLIRSATSIGANIIEGQNSLTSKGFVNSYRIALKSSNESGFWLKFIKDSDFNKEEINDLLSESEQLSKIVASIILKFKID